MVKISLELHFTYVQEEDVLGEPLNGFQQEPLETEAGLALGVLVLEEVDKLGPLLDGLLQDGHGLREVVHVLTVVPHHLLAAELCVCERRRERTKHYRVRKHDKLPLVVYS